VDHDTTTQIAAVVAAATGLVAAIAGIWNLVLTALRNRPGLSVFTREFAADPYGHERYVEVVVVNAKPRPNSVVEIGLRMRGQGKTWKEADGSTRPELPVVLKDGEVVTMTWLRQELGQEFWEGEADIAGCFAIDGRGREVVGGPLP
jgi:hypothetical protein